MPAYALMQFAELCEKISMQAAQSFTVEIGDGTSELSTGRMDPRVNVSAGRVGFQEKWPVDNSVEPWPARDSSCTGHHILEGAKF